MPEFDFTGVEYAALLLHHGCTVDWGGEYDRPEVRLAWELTLHTEPKLFSGGEVEFADGTTIVPASGRLLFWHPAQRMRVRPVECWSAHVLNGRWSICGTVTGPAPDGWADRLAQLRG